MLLRDYVAHEQPERIVLIGALCPACGIEHNLRVDAEYWADDHRRAVARGYTGPEKKPWIFNGDYQRPTFSPSILANKDRHDPDRPLCHSFLENGHWRFLADCTHDLAGQTVPMIPLDT